MKDPIIKPTSKTDTEPNSCMSNLSHHAIPTLMLSLDRRIFDKNSEVRRRMVDYGSIFSQLHIIVFSRRKHQLFEPEKIAPNVWIYPTDSWTRWLYVFDVFSIVKRELVVSGELAVNVISASEFESGFIGVLLARTYNRRFQLQIHGDPWNQYSQKKFIFNAIFHGIEHYVLSHTDCVRVVSEHVKNEVARRYPRLSNYISILPVFVDIDKMRNTKPSFDLHERYPQFNFIILMVSRLSPEKNIFFALDIFADIVQQHPRAGLIIVGDGPLEKKIRRYTHTRALSQNVIFEGWQSELVSYYKSANLFLHTSLY